MRLGLKCSCGHELNFNENAIELFINANCENLIITCFVCKKEILIVKNANKLSSHECITNTNKSNMAKIDYDTNPISSCYIP